jgi:NAD-dependent deacetylase
VDDLTDACELVRRAAAVTALTGAGISTDSGIPDFRGPDGVWTLDPEAERLSTLSHYLADPDVRRRSWRSRLAHPARRARPNPGHLALLELERQGRLAGIVTQNTDGLHALAGTSPDLLVEIHGNQHWTRCWSCGDRRPMAEALARVEDGEDDPDCRACGGILKSATISFGQQLDPADLRRACAMAATCDLLLAVGSTLTVHPAAALVPLAKSHGARVVIVNRDPTDMDYLADAVSRGSISEVLPRLTAT